MDEYEKWAVYQYDWKKQRDASITELTFPFSYRPGQKELAAMVYHTVEKGKRLFVEAPTGVGTVYYTHLLFAQHSISALNVRLR